MTKRATHRHASGRTKCVDIAPNVCLQPIGHSSAPKGTVLNTPEADAYGTHHAGFIIGHDRDGLEHRCEGMVTTDTCESTDARSRWSMTGSLEGGDLTLSPSVLCRNTVDGGEDGFHGFVRDGKWVPA